jgi:hypothetical protein
MEWYQCSLGPESKERPQAARQLRLGGPVRGTEPQTGGVRVGAAASAARGHPSKCPATSRRIWLTWSALPGNVR